MNRTDSYFEGLQDGARQGELDAQSNSPLCPIAPLSKTLLQAGYSFGFDAGYREAYRATRQEILAARAQTLADKCRHLDGALKQTTLDDLDPDLDLDRDR